MSQLGPGLARRIDHVGVVVRDIDASLGYYVDVLGLTVSVDVSLADGSTRLAYLEAGDTTLQLVQPLRVGPLTEFLESRGEGLHHICFAVDDLVEAIQSLPGQEPDDGIYVGGRNCRVSFIRARPNGVAVELTEMRPVAQPVQSAPLAPPQRPPVGGPPS
jgi:methylmalonyl-CoA/ethylmalonyl-CoA epimerase